MAGLPSKARQTHRGRQALGRGLAQLTAAEEKKPRLEALPKSDARAVSGQSASIPLIWLEPDPDQPRRQFPEEEIAELAESIAQKGILQPLLARPLPSAAKKSPRYRLIAGERRWRAAQKAGLLRVPVLVRQTSPDEALELALVENLQRQNLNPLEEARAYDRLSRKFGRNASEIGTAIGKSRAYIANTLRLLRLPENVLALLAEGRLSAGHARALLALPKKEQFFQAQKIIQHRLNVRQIEALGTKRGTKRHGKTRRLLPAANAKDANMAAMAKRFERALGVRVELVSQSQGSWQLRLMGRDLDQFDAIAKKLLA